MGLELDESKEVEIQKVNQEIALLETSVPWYFENKEKALVFLQCRYDQTQDIYAKRQEVKKALVEAETSKSNFSLWQDALFQAKQANKLELSLLLFRLDYAMSKINEFRMTIIGIKFFLKFSFSVNEESGDNSLLLRLFWLLLLVQAISNLYFASKTIGLGEYLVVSPLVKEVLSSADIVGFNLQVNPEEFLADSNSLISVLINKENNASELDPAESDRLPENMCCMITGEVMTDPVYSDEKSARFERLALLRWLEKRRSHPCTNQPLDISELKRDFSLKRDIDKFIKYEIKNYAPLLFNSSDDSLAGDDQDVSEQKILNSAH